MTRMPSREIQFPIIFCNDMSISCNGMGLLGELVSEHDLLELGVTVISCYLGNYHFI